MSLTMMEIIGQQTVKIALLENNIQALANENGQLKEQLKKVTGAADNPNAKTPAAADVQPPAPKLTVVPPPAAQTDAPPPAAPDAPAAPETPQA